MHTDQVREKLRNTLISELGITDEAELERRIDDMLAVKRDAFKHVEKKKVYPTPEGFLTKEEIKKRYS